MSTGPSDPIRALADISRPVRAADLLTFSDAPAALVRDLRLAWPEIPLARRRAIVRRMNDIAEDNLDANFHAVLKVAVQDADAGVRIAAIEGLWEDSSPSLVTVLSGIVESDPDPRVRAAAAAGLQPFAERAALGKLAEARSTAVRQCLVGSYAKPSEDQDVRLAALISMAVWEDQQVRQAIRDTYASSDPHLRAGAVCAMGVNLDPAWERFVLSELSSGFPEVRYEAARAAGALELSAAVGDLAELTKDADIEIRLAAVTALGEIGGGEARRTLRQLASSGDAAMREAAEEALEVLRFNADPLSPTGKGVDVQALARAKKSPGSKAKGKDVSAE